MPRFGLIKIYIQPWWILNLIEKSPEVKNQLMIYKILCNKDLLITFDFINLKYTHRWTHYFRI